MQGLQTNCTSIWYSFCGGLEGLFRSLFIFFSFYDDICNFFKLIVIFVHKALGDIKAFFD